MKKKAWIWIGLVVVVLAVLIVIFRLPTQPASELTLPAILPLTGPSTDLGRSVANGMEMARDDLNAANGGLQLGLAIDDSKGNPGEAVTVYRSLTARSPTPVVLSWMSSVARALSPLSRDEGEALFVGAALEGLTVPSGLVIRVWPRAEQLAQDMGEYALHTEHQRIAILPINDDYGRSVAATFSKVLAESGSIEVVATEPLDLGATDFRLLLERVRLLEPDVVYMPAYGAAYVYGIKQIREILGPEVEIWADLPLLSSFTLPNLGDEIEGVVVPATALDVRPYPTQRAKDFATRYETRYGRRPDFNSGLGYMMYHIAASARLAGRETGADVADFVSSTAHFDGPLGAITYDQKNDCHIPLMISRIVDGIPQPIPEGGTGEK